MPLSRTERATSAKVFSGNCFASAIIIGKFTPLTTSMALSSSSIDEMSVGAPPNMSVSKSTPRPCDTRAMARSSASRATSRSSCQSTEAVVTFEIGPTIISAVANNSLPKCPWVTITPPTNGIVAVLVFELITFISELLMPNRALSQVSMHRVRVIPRTA